MDPLEVKGISIGTGIPKTIVPLVGPLLDDLVQQAHTAIASGVDCLEWRIDLSPHANDRGVIAEQARVLSAICIDRPLIATIRTAGQGGSIDCSRSGYMDEVRALIDLDRFDIIDIEAWIGEDAVRGLVERVHQKHRLAMVSHHDLEKTPSIPDMISILQKMQHMGADVCKLAVMARSLSDALDVLMATHYRSQEDPDTLLLTIAMGEQGRLTRYLGGSYGSAMTFCSLDASTAPGQMSLDETRSIMMRLHDTRHLVTLLGDPTSHSLSPFIHERSFGHAGVPVSYLNYDVKHEEDLPAVMGILRSLDVWDGCNITMPYKQAVIPYLDGMDDTARYMGSVNVVHKKGGKLYGYNTDGAGFWRAVRKAGVSIANKAVTLIGCGGAGSAILVQAALEGVSSVDVLVRPGGRSWGNAHDLAQKLQAVTDTRIEVLPIDDDAVGASLRSVDIVVNATPVGMSPNEDETPVPVRFLRSDMVVADVIYQPRETRLLREAHEVGCTVIPGLGMLVEQAAQGEKIWYDIDMDTERIATEIDERERDRR